jgi:EAL domain-containing protein (putative c-di-GMP-specific phosphodiesterase class I)
VSRREDDAKRAREPQAQPQHRPAPQTPADELLFGPLAQGTAPTQAVGSAARSGEAGTIDRTDELRELEVKLNACLAALTMHFQPIVDAKTRARFGYEALLRSADKSLPHPGAILDAAERLERIPMLGRAVRSHTARVIANAPPARGVVFVNLHLLDLFDKQLTSPFSPLSKQAQRVVLEITERTSLDGQEDVRYRVAELRELGYRIAIDDLGGGHARMTTFTPLDTDFVKLDMSLVRDLNKHPMKQRLVRSIIELCTKHGTKVIGEGVETAAEAQILVDLGCDYLQGYVIAKPAPPFCDPL